MAAKRSSKGRVLITGAGGCVGIQLVEILRQKGYRLRLVDRAGVELPRPSRDLEVSHVDLTDFAKIPRLMRGVSAVVHLAALVDIGKTFSQLAPLNLEATKRLYEAAARRRVRQFLFFSTGSIYAFKDGFLTEKDPVNPLNDYGRSKLLAEDYLRSRPASGPTVNIIRPALIFGPRGKVLLNMMAPLPSLVRQISHRSVRLSGGPATNSVHSFDVANAAAFLLEHPQPHGEILNVANDDPVDVGRMVEVMMGAEGVRGWGPVLPYPKGLLDWGIPVISQPVLLSAVNTGLGWFWGRVRKKKNVRPAIAPHVDREIMDFLIHDVRFSNRKIKKLGFKLRYPDFKSGWEDTVRWMRDAKWLPEVL